MRRLLTNRWLAAVVAAGLGLATLVAPQVPALATGNSATQTTSVTVTAPCTLSVSLQNAGTVSFGSIAAGSTTSPADLGYVQWGASCANGAPESWTGSIDATDLVALASANCTTGCNIPASGITVTPSSTFICVSTGCPTSGTPPTAGSGGSLAFSTATSTTNNCPDANPGHSYTCPLTLATATAGTTTLPATWQQGNGSAGGDNSATLTVPSSAAYVSFQGTLQYTITG
jgi:hypothetical protein